MQISCVRRRLEDRLAWVCGKGDGATGGVVWRRGGAASSSTGASLFEGWEREKVRRRGTVILCRSQLKNEECLPQKLCRHGHTTAPFAPLPTFPASLVDLPISKSTPPLPPLSPRAYSEEGALLPLRCSGSALPPGPGPTGSRWRQRGQRPVRPGHHHLLRLRTSPSGRVRFRGFR